MLYCCFSQSLQKDESDFVKKNEQAQSIQLGHNKVAGVSADQPLTDINRSHLSHVKDPKSSDDQPLLLGCGVFDRCYKLYYRGMSVAVKQFNQHLSSKFDVTKEALLLKQLDHPCFPFVNGISVERKPYMYLLVLQFCNVEGKVYTLHRALHSHFLGVEKSRVVGHNFAASGSAQTAAQQLYDPSGY